MKKWIHRGKKRKNAQERHQNHFGRSNQPPIGRSRKLGFQRGFHVPASKKNWDSTFLYPKGTEIPLRCVQTELRFYWQVPKSNWDCTALRPKRTEIPLAHVQKELLFHLPASEKHWNSNYPCPKKIKK
jgi:hypothetical protein